MSKVISDHTKHVKICINLAHVCLEIIVECKLVLVLIFIVCLGETSNDRYKYSESFLRSKFLNAQLAQNSFLLNRIHIFFNLLINYNNLR